MYTEYCINMHTDNDANAQYTFPCLIHSFERLWLQAQDSSKHNTAVPLRYRSQSKKYPTSRRRRSRKQTCTGSYYSSDHSLLLGHSWVGRLRRPTHHQPAATWCPPGIRDTRGRTWSSPKGRCKKWVRQKAYQNQTQQVVGNVGLLRTVLEVGDAKV